MSSVCSMMLVLLSAVVTDCVLSVFLSFNICCHRKLHTVLEHASIKVCVFSITKHKQSVVYDYN